LESAKALCRLLKAAGMSFGILGREETCDGNELMMLGESGLFEALTKENIALFRKHGVRKIVTLSPHAYNAIKNHYPQYGGEFEVRHYTEMLGDLVSDGKVAFSREGDRRITYHDPCFLGRWNGFYAAPRAILKAVPGARFVEMGKSGESALCCGGGGGNFVMDLLGGSKDSPARRRIREAVGTGAEVLAVACPKCLIMLTEAAKAEDVEDRIAVKDISEIVEEAADEFPV